MTLTKRSARPPQRTACGTLRFTTAVLLKNAKQGIRDEPEAAHIPMAYILPADNNSEIVRAWPNDPISLALSSQPRSLCRSDARLFGLARLQHGEVDGPTDRLRLELAEDIHARLELLKKGG